MKKLSVLFAAVMLIPLHAKALNITDPFFMPASGQVVSDTSLGFTNNALRLNKSWGLYEKISVGVLDGLTVAASIGWADIKHGGDGMQDITFHGKYRFMNDISHGRFLDLDAYFSPELFDSPYNHDGGAAKGSTDFGMYGSVGTAQAADNFTIGGRFGFDYIGHTDETSSGTVLDAGVFARYYFNEYNALGLSVDLKSYLGFEKDSFAAALGANYSFDLIEEKMAVVPFYSIEVNNKSIPSCAVWGVNARYLF